MFGAEDNLLRSVGHLPNNDRRYGGGGGKNTEAVDRWVCVPSFIQQTLHTRPPAASVSATRPDSAAGGVGGEFGRIL